MEAEYVAKIDNIFLKCALGEGAFGSVFQGIKDGEEYAIKVLSEKAQKLYKEKASRDIIKEATILKNFHHENILRIYNYSEDKLLTFIDGKTETTPYLQLELVTGGILFDYLCLSGRFPDNMARFFFKQLFSALEHIYSKGFNHRDLKTENVMLDEKGNIKLVDFGCSILNEGPNKDGILNDYNVGTERYNSPELQKGTPYHAEKSDVYSLGIILFLLIAAHPPFGKNIFICSSFKMLQEFPEMFWQKGTKYPKAFSPSLRSLLQKMLMEKPSKRPTLAEIKTEPWFNEPAMEPEKVYEEIMKRRNFYNEKWKEATPVLYEKYMKKKKEEVTKLAMLGHTGDTEGKKSVMPEGQSLVNTAKRVMKNYKPVVQEFTKLFTVYEPNDIITELTRLILEDNGIIEFKPNKCKGKCKYEGLADGNMEFNIYIEKVEEHCNVIRFCLVEGSRNNFIDTFRRLGLILQEKGIVINQF